MIPAREEKRPPLSAFSSQIEVPRRKAKIMGMMIIAIKDELFTKFTILGYNVLAKYVIIIILSD